MRQGDRRAAADRYRRSAGRDGASAVSAHCKSPSPWGGVRGGGSTPITAAANPPLAPPSRAGSLRIAGYAALFAIPDGAKDTILPGAFARTLAERTMPLPLFWQHRPDRRAGAEGVHRKRSARTARRAAPSRRGG
ncbi:HK97 family phage prohead protease [Erythrobacter sp. EC-HK427]|uniref:HK97 family phage prohead protease n=1 Tax=Erythrobacter sp. EC-HK427 TaxID=2038396 RepID=UPI0030DC0D52